MDASDSKNVFIAHTKGDDRHRGLVQMLESALAGTGFSIWSYGDWKWEHRVPSATSRLYRREGLKLDPTRYMLRDPRPFIHKGRRPEVDEDTLRRMFLLSTVIVLLEPTTGIVTPGIAVEMAILGPLLSAPDRFIRGRPLTVRCCWHDANYDRLALLPHDLVLSLPSDATDLCRAADICMLAIARSWLVQLFTTSTRCGPHLLLLGGRVDSGLAALISSVPYTNDFKSFLEELCPKPPSTASHTAREADDIRIAAALGRQMLEIDFDRVRHALKSVQELVTKFGPPLSRRDNDWKRFAASIDIMRREALQLEERLATG